MKLKLTISTIGLLLMLATTQLASAQLRTPFEKVERNEQGKRQYIYPNPQFGKSAITISYGYAPINSFDWWSNPIFDSKFKAGQRFNQKNSSTFGVVSIAYNNQLTPWLELQIPLSFSATRGVFTDMTNGENPNYNDTWISLMPNVKISWAYNDLIHLYSRIGVGVALGNRYENYNAGMNHKAGFMWQFSPIGFEVGRRVRFFIEAGFGQMGVVNAGVKFQFNKSDYKPDGTKREVKEWYERRTY